MHDVHDFGPDDPFCHEPKKERPIGGIEEVQRRDGGTSFCARFVYESHRYSITFRTRREAEQYLEWAAHYTHWESPTREILKWWLKEFRTMPFADLDQWYFIGR